MSSPSTTTSLSTILGAVIMTGIISGLFFGVTCIQTYSYLIKSDRDEKITRHVVRLLWAVDALQFAMYTYTIWYYVVDAYDTAWGHQVMNWSFKLSIWLAVALVLLIDILYTLSIVLMMNSRLVPGLVLLAVVAGNVVAVVLGVKIILFTDFTGIYDISRSAIIYLFFLLFCIKAVAIAAVMTSHLPRLAKLEERLPEDRNIVDGLALRFVRIFVGSSLVVALSSFAVLACHLVMPRSMSCVVVYMAVSKLYHNCYLSFLLRGSALLPWSCRYPPTSMKEGHGHQSVNESKTANGKGVNFNKVEAGAGATNKAWELC